MKPVSSVIVKISVDQFLTDAAILVWGEDEDFIFTKDDLLGLIQDHVGERFDSLLNEAVATEILRETGNEDYWMDSPEKHWKVERVCIEKKPKPDYVPEPLTSEPENYVRKKQ